MKSHQVSLIGAILFFLGLPFLIISWYNSYPIHMSLLDEIMFSQFSPLIWPGILLTSIGLFITGYFSTRNSVKAICACIFPISLYSYVLYFNGTATSDIGNVKSMFDVFHFTGIDSSVISYFQYPTYFTFNEITARFTGMDANSIAMIFFALFGVLLGLYLYLFLFKVTKSIGCQVAFVGTILYFSMSFSFLNYQWVPQTLALIFFFLLLIMINFQETKYKIVTLIVFVCLVFTHLFIPVIFLLFFGLYSLKKRESFRLFMVMMCLYVAVLVYFSSYYLPQIVSAFMETVYGFGGYKSTISESFKATTSLFSQLVSNINRIRVPLTIVVLVVGFLIGLYNRKIHYKLLILGVVGGLYLILGLAFPILGLRALQVLIVALVVGIGFLILKTKKPTMTLVTILVILSIFGPIRFCYDQTQFIMDEEISSCRFLSVSSSHTVMNFVAVDQVDWGYFTNIAYYNNSHTVKARPSSLLFYDIFNTTMKRNYYSIYNPNVGKEIRDNGLIPDYKERILRSVYTNNKIYSCRETFIMTG